MRAASSRLSSNKQDRRSAKRCKGEDLTASESQLQGGGGSNCRPSLSTFVPVVASVWIAQTLTGKLSFLPPKLHSSFIVGAKTLLYEPWRHERALIVF